MADSLHTSLPILPASVAPVPVSCSGVVTAVDAPAPVSAAAVTSNSDSRPSLATGMSSDPANSGGEHEAVTALPIEHDRFCIELETGTSPGACGTERGRVGAANSELSSPDWSVDPQINRGRCAEAGLCADHAQDGSISGDRTTERFSGTTAQRRCVASLARSLLVTAGETATNSDPMHHPTFPPASETATEASASSLFSSNEFGPVDDTLAGWRESRFSEKLPAEFTGSAQAADSSPFKATDSRTNFDPGMSGFGDNFEAEIAILEAQWARDGIIMNATTFFTEAASSIPPASNSTA